jgi:hypothetical protein
MGRYRKFYRKGLIHGALGGMAILLLIQYILKQIL